MGIIERLINAVNGPAQTVAPAQHRHIVLGALLSLVAQADGKVTPGEIEAMREILQKRGVGGQAEQNEIMAAAHQALAEHLDWEGFTREINQWFAYAERLEFVADLFRVARSDEKLDTAENETIRKLSELLWVSHTDFIQAKLAAKTK